MDSRHNEDPDTLPWKAIFENAQKEEKVLAAFRNETAYRTFLARCMTPHMRDVVLSLVEDARRNTQTMELAGIEDDTIEENGDVPYDELLKALEEGIQQVKMLKGHRHEWVRPEDAPSYCRVCQMPGDI